RLGSSTVNKVDPPLRPLSRLRDPARRGTFRQAISRLAAMRWQTESERNEQLPSALEAAVEEIRREAVPALKKLSAGLDTWTTLGSNLITSRERLDQLLIR